MSYSSLSCGGKVFGKKPSISHPIRCISSKGTTYSKAHPCKPTPCSPCYTSCKPKSCCSKSSCNCDPCYKPYTVDVCNPDGSHTIDLCVNPPDCLIADDTYNSLYSALKECIISSRLDILLFDTVDSDSYNQLLDAVNVCLGKIAESRIVVTLPDGTVVIDTYYDTNNTYANFMGKNINENHNSRVAFINTQQCEDGVGYERKLSSTTQQIEKYVAIRLGEYLNSFGSVRMSVPDEIVV